MRIYVASSWKNPYQPSIVEALRSKHHEVYDFRNPRPGDKGFHWSEIDPNYKTWSPAEYREALNHQMAESGFKSDFDAMKWADVFVGVAPFGRSTSLEMGWAAGAGKPTIIYLPEMPGEAELMVKMCSCICVTCEELLAAFRKIKVLRSPWHPAQDGPEDDRRIYIKKTDNSIYLGWFGGRHLGNFEMCTLNYEDDFNIPIAEIERWAYVEELEGL